MSRSQEAKLSSGAVFCASTSKETQLPVNSLVGMVTQVGLAESFVPGAPA